MDLDKRTVSILAIIVIIILAACFIFLAPGTTTGSKCTKDSDCVQKKEPYCCGEVVEYTDACYPANANPPATKDCTGNDMCPKLMEIEGCECQNGVCSPVYPESSDFMESMAREPPADCIPEGKTVSHEGPDSLQCCEGLTLVSNGVIDNEGNCQSYAGSSTCTKCGDGNCGAGEDRCNCPEDCGGTEFDDSPFGLWGPQVRGGSGVGGWCPPSNVWCGKPLIDCITDPDGPPGGDLCWAPIDIENLENLNVKWTTHHIRNHPEFKFFVALDPLVTTGLGEGVFEQYHHVQSVVQSYDDVDYFTFGLETPGGGPSPEEFAVYTRISYRALKDLGGSQKLLIGGGVNFESYGRASYFDVFLENLAYMEDVEKGIQEYDGRYDSLYKGQVKFLNEEEVEALFEEDDYDKYMDGLHVSIATYEEGSTNRVREDLEKSFDAINTLFGSYGYDNLILWITQTGFPSAPFAQRSKTEVLPIDTCLECTEAMQAHALISIYTISRYLGFEKIFWLTFHEYWWFGGWDEYHNRVALIHDGRGQYDLGPGVKKLSYYTYKLMIEKLEGSDWGNIQEVYANDNVYAYKFINKETNKPTWVVWWDYFEDEGTTSKTVSLSSLGITGTVEVTEAIPHFENGLLLQNSGEVYPNFFDMETKSVSNGQLSLILRESPVYIEES